MASTEHGCGILFVHILIIREKNQRLEVSLRDRVLTALVCAAGVQLDLKQVQDFWTTEELVLEEPDLRIL